MQGRTLSDPERERLACLIEECSEVQKAATKILRHGYESRDPTNPKHLGNRQDLQDEIHDVIGVINMMFENCDFYNLDHKHKRSSKYMHFNKE